MTITYQHVLECADFIDKHLLIKSCETALILGSGQGGLVDSLCDARRIPYAEIPHFPRATVKGHPGELVVGRLEDRQIMVMAGRFHYYEGYPPAQVAFPVRVFRALGARTLILTNASGAVTPNYDPGDLVLLTDYINLTGTNPLIGENLDEQGVRFPDMTEVYPAFLREKAYSAAQRAGIELKEGIYAAVSGPSYETPAEIRMLAGYGADLVGMSTVFESIAARHCGLNTLGIACVTNRAAGVGGSHALLHEEVLHMGGITADKLLLLIEEFMKEEI